MVYSQGYTLSQVFPTFWAAMVQGYIRNT